MWPGRAAAIVGGPVVTADPVDAQAAARARRSAKATHDTLTRVIKSSLSLWVAAAVVGLAVAIVARDAAAASGLIVVLTLVGTVVAWWPLRDARLRLAWELVADHDCHEREEWKHATGARMPGSLKAASRWIEEHPGTTGRASFLLALGRLEEADRAIEALPPTTADKRFGIALLRATRQVYAGEAPEFGALRDQLVTLADRRLRRHRRACVALLEAGVAAEHGEDRVALLAGVRREVGEVHSSMRIGRVLGRIGLLGVLTAWTAILATLLITS